MQDFSLALNHHARTDRFHLTTYVKSYQYSPSQAVYAISYFITEYMELLICRLETLTDRTQKVIQTCNSTNVISGIPQGSVLGLFYLSCVIIIYK